MNLSSAASNSASACFIAASASVSPPSAASSRVDELYRVVPVLTSRFLVPREAEPLPAAAVLALEAALPGHYRVMVPLGAGAGLYWALGAITGHMQRYAPGPGDVIVANVAGRLVRRNAFGSVWRAAVKEAGLPEGTRYHALRHFYASALIRRESQPEGSPGAAEARDDRRDDGHLRAPVPDSGDLGRGAVEAALGVAEAEQGRNREAR